MPGEDVYSWSTTASANASADTLINWAEGQPRNSVNNSARSMMAALAKQFALFTGSIVTAGTANAQTFSSGVGYSAVPTNFYCRLKVGVGLTNTGAMTLRMDGLASVAVLQASGSALSGGEFTASGYVELVNNGSNWILLSSTSAVGGGGGGGGSGGPPSSITLVTTPGNFVYHPAGTMTAILVETVGGGGGGGGTNSFPGGGSGVGEFYIAGSGGGSGSYARKLMTAAEVGASQAMIIGAGGASGPGQNGQDGGVTQFGTVCKAYGGGGGQYQGYGGGAGGAIGIGDVACSGAPGETGFVVNLVANEISGGLHSDSFSRSGAGGSSYFGGGGVLPVMSSFFGTYTGGYGYYGGGGSGGFNGHSGTSAQPAASGGNGGSGLIVITEYGGHGTVGSS